MNAEETWNAAMWQLELQLDRGSFDTYLRGATLIDAEDGVLIVGVRNSYAADMLQRRLYRTVRRIVRDVAGRELEIRFEVRQQSIQPAAGDGDDRPLFRYLAQNTPEESPDLMPGREQSLHERIRPTQRPDLPESELNPHLTFNRFVVHGATRIAFEAAAAVAESPSHVYNPFFVYGGVGLGKTHLLHAIAHACQSRGLSAIYIPSEAFTNDLVNAIRSKTTAMFREKYRSVDVLLVDDVQFIAGKESTQEEFFHTFNALYTYNKQVVLASDRPPHELTLLEDRLRSRFQGGLVVDIQPPEYEARLAMLHMWMEERGVNLEDSVLHLIAERAPNNIRELRGVFNNMVAKARFSHKPLTPERAASTLDRFSRPRDHGRKRHTAEQILQIVALHFQLNVRDLTGKKRTGRINHARQLAMFLVREMTELSLPQMGEVFGRSHTTVLHGCNKVAEEVEVDSSLRTTLEQLHVVLTRPSH